MFDCVEMLWFAVRMSATGNALNTDLDSWPPTDPCCFPLTCVCVCSTGPNGNNRLKSIMASSNLLHTAHSNMQHRSVQYKYGCFSSFSCKESSLNADRPTRTNIVQGGRGFDAPHLRRRWSIKISLLAIKWRNSFGKKPTKSKERRQLMSFVSCIKFCFGEMIKCWAQSKCGFERTLTLSSYLFSRVKQSAVLTDSLFSPVSV